MGNALRLTATIAALTALASPAVAQAADMATVVQVRSQLRGAIAPSSTWTDVAPSTGVHAGDTLKTGLASAADVVLPSGGHLVMGENSILRLKDLDGLGARVLTGRVRLVAPPRGQLNIEAGDMVLSGTDAEAVIERAGGTWRVAVLAGTINVADGDRQPIELPAGKLFTLTGDHPTVAMLGRAKVEDLMQGLQFDQVATGGQPSHAALNPAIASVAAASGANKWVATGLSTLLPGAGQLYAGELPRGLTYLGLNFALLGAGYYFRSNGQNQNANLAAIGLVGLNVLSPLDALLFTPAEKPAK